MSELNFTTYVDALRPSLMKHVEKPEAAVFLLNSVSPQKIGEEEKTGKDYKLPDGSTVSRLLRGVSQVPESIRFATARPEVVENAAAYFRKDVMEDMHPHLKDEATERLLNLIRTDVTIPETRRESLLTLSQGDDYGLFLSEAFIYAMNRPFNPNMDDGHQKISIPLLIFLFCFSVAIYGLTMFTFIKMGEVSQSVILFAFFFPVVLFIFLIGFYFFLWRRDI